MNNVNNTQLNGMDFTKVRFAFGTAKQYSNLEVHDPNTLYFLEDAHQLFKGDVLFASTEVVYMDDLEQKEPIIFNCGSSEEVIE